MFSFYLYLSPLRKKEARNNEKNYFNALLMTLFLLLSCGSGSTNAEDPKTVFLTFIANLGKGFLNVFTSFSDMITGAFGIKADDKKSDIGAYFTRISETMTSIKEKLQDEVAKNGNYTKLKSVVDTFRHIR
ncbi:Variable outer membrane protein (plasmid) [Borrelia hermsii YBT]|uniref:Variable large protein n=1 Tax=Borrelia hermsii YBT TaxID=1313295 RepID=W5T244_BORHE|nr:Variable outer membrane protein [Borrelia hermsii YBT]